MHCTACRAHLLLAFLLLTLFYPLLSLPPSLFFSIHLPIYISYHNQSPFPALLFVVKRQIRYNNTFFYFNMKNNKNTPLLAVNLIPGFSCFSDDILIKNVRK